MRILRIVTLLALLAIGAQAADVKISDLTQKTSPSTNTFVEIADMSDTPKSGKALFYDLLEDFLADSDHFDFTTASGLRTGAIKPSAEVSVSRLFINSGVVATNITASRALVSDGNKHITNSAVTATELGFLSGATSALVDLLANQTITGVKGIGTLNVATNLNVARATFTNWVRVDGPQTNSTDIFLDTTHIGSVLNVASTVSAASAVNAQSVFVTNTITHNGEVKWRILTNAFEGFNVFLNLATNSMQFLSVTNNFTLIPTNMAAGQRISLTLFNPTATNITITHTAGIQFYGSSASNVVVASKRLKSAWESQDAAITNVSAAFAAQKN